MLRRRLGIYHPMLDEGVSWRFLPCIFNLENKDILQSLANYIQKEMLQPLKEIEDQLTILKREGKETFFGNPQYEDAAELSAKYMDEYGFTWDEYLEDCTSEYDGLMRGYEEIIELIEYLIE